MLLLMRSLISVTGRWYRPMFLALFLCTINNLTNVVIGKLGKPVHKRSCPYWILMLRTSAFTWVLMRKKKPVISKVLCTSAFTLALIWKKKPLYPIPAAPLVAIVLYLILISIYILCLCLLSSILMGYVFFSLFPQKFPVCIFDTARMILKIKMSKRVKGIHGQIKLLLLNTGFCHLIRQMKSYLKCSHGFSMKYDGPKGTNTQNLNLL